MREPYLAAAAADFRYPAVPEVNYLDREVFAKLRRLNIVPSDLAADYEFLADELDLHRGMLSRETRWRLAQRVGPRRREFPESSSRCW